MTSLDSDAFRQRCIEAVVEEGERFGDRNGVGLVELVAALRTTPPESPAWYKSPAVEQVAASWARRQAHELAVHRMDLEAAAGVAHAPLDPALADDGVDELLTIVVPRWAHTEPLSSAEATAAVTATDSGRTWSVAVTRGQVTVTPEQTGTEGDRAAEQILPGR